jgi:general secretion pathway protein G
MGFGTASVRGFSLIELMVVLGIMGVLAMAALPMVEIQVLRDRERELKRALWELRDAIDAHKKAVDAGELPPGPGGSPYPATLEALVQGAPDLKQGQQRYFLRRVPRDPFAPEHLESAKTWGLRSFQSPAENPVAGVDVYDVFSRSDRIGLNGVPLRQW